MLGLRVDRERCPPCERCLAALACLKGALTQKEAGAPPTLQPQRCSGCGYCSLACPHGAVVEHEGRVYA